MEQHPEILSEGVVRRDGSVTPFNAGDVVAAVIDVFREHEIPVAPQVRARLGKASKALLESGFAPDIVVAACVMAVRLGWYGSVESLAQDMLIVKNGARMSKGDLQHWYLQAAAATRRQQSQVWDTLHSENERLQRARERGIEQ